MELLAARGVLLTHISFAAYSFGGLITRYAIGKLSANGYLQGKGGDSPWPSADNEVASSRSHSCGSASCTGSRPFSPPYASRRVHAPCSSVSGRHGLRDCGPPSAPRPLWPLVPVNFVTIASPHLGCWELPVSVTHQAYNHILPWTLSRTGRQLLLADEWLEGDAGPLPLLAAMATPGTAFYAGLAAFRKRLLLADIGHDRTVPYATAAIAAANPYAHAAEPLSTLQAEPAAGARLSTAAKGAASARCGGSARTWSVGLPPLAKPFVRASTSGSHGAVCSSRAALPPAPFEEAGPLPELPDGDTDDAGVTGLLWLMRLLAAALLGVLPGWVAAHCSALHPAAHVGLGLASSLASLTRAVRQLLGLSGPAEEEPGAPLDAREAWAGPDPHRCGAGAAEPAWAGGGAAAQEPGHVMVPRPLSAAFPCIVTPQPMLRPTGAVAAAQLASRSVGLAPSGAPHAAAGPPLDVLRRSPSSPPLGPHPGHEAASHAAAAWGSRRATPDRLARHSGPGAHVAVAVLSRSASPVPLPPRAIDGPAAACVRPTLGRRYLLRLSSFELQPRPAPAHTAGRAPSPTSSEPLSDGSAERARLGLFVVLLPVLVPLWCVTVAWLAVIWLQHMAVLLAVRGWGWGGGAQVRLQCSRALTPGRGHDPHGPAPCRAQVRPDRSWDVMAQPPDLPREAEQGPQCVQDNGAAAAHAGQVSHPVPPSRCAAAQGACVHSLLAAYAGWHGPHRRTRLARCGPWRDNRRCWAACSAASTPWPGSG